MAEEEEISEIYSVEFSEAEVAVTEAVEVTVVAAVEEEVEISETYSAVFSGAVVAEAAAGLAVATTILDTAVAVVVPVVEDLISVVGS